MLEKRDEIATAFRSSSMMHLLDRNKPAPGPRQQDSYKHVPMWWYGLACLVAVALAIVACEVYPVQLRWYGVLFSLLVSVVFYIPVRSSP